MDEILVFNAGITVLMCGSGMLFAWRKLVVSFFGGDSDGRRSGCMSNVAPESFVTAVIYVLLTNVCVRCSVILLARYCVVPRSTVPVPTVVMMLVLLTFINVLKVLFGMHVLAGTRLIYITFTAVLTIPVVARNF